MNYKLACKMCNTPVSIRNSTAYMRCMCDDEERTIKLFLDGDNNSFVSDKLYLLGTEGLTLCQDGSLLEN